MLNFAADSGNAGTLARHSLRDCDVRHVASYSKQ